MALQKYRAYATSMKELIGQMHHGGVKEKEMALKPVALQKYRAYAPSMKELIGQMHHGGVKEKEMALG